MVGEFGDYGDYRASNMGSNNNEGGSFGVFCLIICCLPIAAFLIMFIGCFLYYSYAGS